MHIVDLAIIGVYFSLMIVMGWHFSRRAKTTERYFLAGRAYSGWIVGVSLFGATISSITFVGYPADAFKTAYLRYAICLMLPVAIFLASRWVVPFYRRRRATTVFEYLEDRFGPRTRVYGGTVFIIAQLLRISIIQYLVALLVCQLTGWNVMVSILVGSLVTAYYTIAGGIEAVIWTDFVQSLILTIGGLTILGCILWRLPGGLGQLLSVATAHGKFMVGDLDPADGRLHAAPWGFALSHKTILMVLITGLFQWLAEYTTNQEVVQRYSTSHSLREARRAIWLCCFTALPTWGYFMFIGTGLFVFYHVFPDPQAAAMLSGARKPEGIVPHFVSTQLPLGLSGLVVAAVLSAAMSAMSSALNSISAVVVTDIYRRHLAADRSDRHYVLVARLVTLASSCIMVGCAVWLFHHQTKTLQDLWTQFQSIIVGGILGIYLFGLLTTRGDGRAVAVGLAFSVSFSALMSLVVLGWLPAGLLTLVTDHFDVYYTGVVGNLLMFLIGYLASFLLPARHHDLTDLTLWTQSKQQ